MGEYGTLFLAWPDRHLAGFFIFDSRTYVAGIWIIE